MELTKENIGKVERYFEKYPAPKVPMRLSVCSVANNPPLLVKTHIATCKTYLNEERGRQRVTPYWERLKMVGRLTKKYYSKTKPN